VNTPKLFLVASTAVIHRLVLILIGILLAGLAMEAVLRIADPIPEVGAPLSAFFTGDPYLGWRGRPNAACGFTGLSSTLSCCRTQTAGAKAIPHRRPMPRGACSCSAIRSPGMGRRSRRAVHRSAAGAPRADDRGG
jgi:hypothetical protein